MTITVKPLISWIIVAVYTVILLIALHNYVNLIQRNAELSKWMHDELEAEQIISDHCSPASSGNGNINMGTNNGVATQVNK